MHELVAGDRVDQYELTELLARSGMASIFKALDRSSGQTVALKVPHLQYESDIAFYQRFEREEKIGQKLDHPNIVRVLSPEKKSRMYLVMEFAEGRSLRAVQGDRPMEVGKALDIAAQLVSALVYLHSRGIVHRDLKPDNVLLTAEGQIKLIDFGIAMDEAARRLTWFGLSVPIGTPDYMAPEQVRGKRGDVRTDLYALGTMLFEMITGELPYPHGNVHATMRAKLNQDARRPSDVFSSIDPKIEEIIMHAIERSPRERYETARDMLADLENPSQVGDPRSHPATGDPSPRATSHSAPPPGPRGSRARHRNAPRLDAGQRPPAAHPRGADAVRLRAPRLLSVRLRAPRPREGDGMGEHSLNLAWLLLCSFLVMFMQLGFAMVETGFTRSKNAVHTMAMNFVVYPLGVLGFWLVGYGLAMGGVESWQSLGGSARPDHLELGVRLGGKFFGLIGGSKFGLMSVAHDPANLAMFLFSAVFMDTAATIPTGALAERWRFASFVIYGLVMSMFLYPLFANGVWGGGWLSALGVNFGLGHGHVDFAGSSVVHMTGGVTAFAGVMNVGPRIGKFRKDGTISMIQGHNLPMSVMGTFILAFGWFGFNAGSTLAATEPRIAEIAVNTAIASATGGLTSLGYVWQRHRRPDVGMACNGFLGGLVAITASCAFVAPPAAALIGVVAGLIVVLSVGNLERWRIDDPVGAISVHGVCGAWGTVAVGIFADGSFGEGWNGVAGPVRGLLFGDASQFEAQLVGVVTNGLFVFGAATLMFRGLDRLIGNRVSAEVETAGLDDLEMGSDAYPRD